MSCVANQDQTDQSGQEQNSARLLVVDDEESVVVTVSEVLRRQGFLVDTALSGQEAVARLRDTQYDLVLTDLQLGDFDGISVLAEVHRNAPLTITIVLTGYASLESAIAAMRQGAYDYLIKPCVIEDMKHTIQRGLEHRRLILLEQEARDSLERLNIELERRVEERTAELQRVNQELARANRMKDIFLATLSHELRTPLTPILAWSKVLRSGKADAALMAQGLDAIERNVQLQTRLIDDLLDVSRIVTGKLHFEKEPTDLCAIVETAAETVREKAEARRLDLKLGLSDTPVVVLGSPVRLQQVVLNLLTNAIKFTENGGKVEVEARRDNEEALLVISDTGEGIAPDFLPHIFDPFSQAEFAMTHQKGGLGLGLAIVRKLVEMHGGRVRAESAGVGKGARFIIGLPCATDAKIEDQKQEELDYYDVPQPVLIVEDSVDTLEVLRATFQEMGCRVMAADSAGAAMELIAVERPGLIISDIGMPGEDGYKLLTRIRRMPGLEKVPAIALSGFARPEDKARSQAAGFTAHMAKPVNIDKLLALIQKIAV